MCLTLWLIYMADHHFDQHLAAIRYNQLKGVPLRVILPLIAICTMVLAFFTLPWGTIRSGLILGIVVTGYLTIRKRLRWFKELAIALIYIAGVWVAINGTWSMPPGSFIAVSLLVFMNILEYSWLDRQEDLENGSESLMTLLSTRHAKFLRDFTRGCLLTGFMLTGYYELAIVIALFIALSFLPRQGLNRVLPDLAMVLPFILRLISD